MKLVIATRNEDKLIEIKEIFEGSSFELSSLSEFPQAPEVEETGDTLLENALLKAESAAKATGLPALADDTGLFVEALDGEPGVVFTLCGRKCIIRRKPRIAFEELE